MHSNTSEPFKLKAVSLPELEKCGRVIPRHVVRASYARKLVTA